VNNYFEDVVIAESPRVLSKEQVIVYVPLSSNGVKGMCSFNNNQFLVVQGHVQLNDAYIDNLVTEILSKLTLSINSQSTKSHIVELRYNDEVVTSAILNIV
jgi:hypothetical protein